METALITGATAGIGKSIAYQLAAKGYDLYLVARREKRLIEISEDLQSKFNIKVSYLVADLTNKEAPQNIYNYGKGLDLDISILVLNAGYQINTRLEDASLDEEEKCLRVLGLSVIMQTKTYLKDLMARGGGHVMVVSSISAFAPPSTEFAVLYGPVKTFMNRFSESLNFYNKYGITSTAVCPGYTVTNFHTASGVQEEMDSVPSFLKKSAKRIAQEGVDAMFKGKKVSVPTKTWKIIVFLLKIIPHSVFRLVSGLLAPGRYNEV